MTFRARLGSDRSRRSRRRLIEGHLDVVNTMTISAYGRARHSPNHGLSMNALNELTSLCPVTLSASAWNVDFGNR